MFHMEHFNNINRLFFGHISRVNMRRDEKHTLQCSYMRGPQNWL